jgi:hypothetical protein
MGKMRKMKKKLVTRAEVKQKIQKANFLHFW